MNEKLRIIIDGIMDGIMEIDEHISNEEFTDSEIQSGAFDVREKTEKKEDDGHE